jgi:predicted transcriptional regulator
MPNLNIRLDDELMRRIRVKAALSDKTRRDWVIDSLSQLVGSADSQGSESKSLSEPRTVAEPCAI